jgi:hypothetical protein
MKGANVGILRINSSNPLTNFSQLLQWWFCAQIPVATTIMLQPIDAVIYRPYCFLPLLHLHISQYHEEPLSALIHVFQNCIMVSHW